MRHPKTGAVRNADRKCKAKTNFAACGQNLGVYTAKPHLPGKKVSFYFPIHYKPPKSPLSGGL